MAEGGAALAALFLVGDGRIITLIPAFVGAVAFFLCAAVYFLIDLAEDDGEGIAPGRWRRRRPHPEEAPGAVHSPACHYLYRPHPGRTCYGAVARYPSGDEPVAVAARPLGRPAVLHAMRRHRGDDASAADTLGLARPLGRPGGAASAGGGDDRGLAPRQTG